MDDIAVPFSGGSDKRPLAIQIGFNPTMAKWEMMLVAGNFPSEASAKKYADGVAEFLRENADAEMLKAQ